MGIKKKKKHWVDLYHYRMDVNTLPTHIYVKTSGKVNFASDDPLMLPIFKDQGEGVVMVKHPIIWYLWKALNVLCTGHLDKTVTCTVSEKS